MVPPRHSSAPITGLCAHGVELDQSPGKLGFLRETQWEAVPPALLRRQMDDDGYLFCRHFWSRDEVQYVRDSITTQLERLEFLRPDFPRNEARALSGRKVGRAIGNPLDQNDPPLRALVFGDHIMAFFARILGGPIRHLDYIWFRTKGPGIGSPLHCDLVYMGRGTHQLFTAWVPLGDIDLNMGGYLALEGSHRHSERLRPYLSRDVDEYCLNRDSSEAAADGTRWDGTLSENPVALQQSLGGRWLTAEEFQMGDAVFFNMTLVHGSLDNQTDLIRLSVDTRYQLAAAPIDERWVGKNPPGHANSMRRGRVC